MILGIIASGQISMSSSGGGGGSDFNLANFPGYVAVYESPYIDGSTVSASGTVSSSWTTISSPTRRMSRDFYTAARVLPAENTNQSPFGFLGTSDIGVFATYYYPIVNNLQYLDETVYLAYDFRESGTGSSGYYISLENITGSKSSIYLTIEPFGTGVKTRLIVNSQTLRDLNSPSGRRSGVVAVSTKYDTNSGTASFVTYFNSASYLNSYLNYPPTFMTSDINTLQLHFNKASNSNADWVGSHGLVMCASVHSPATVSSNLSYLSSRFGVFL
jgi:hypothetical protein